MSVSTPTLLAIALLAFYLKDHLLWLRPDEVVLVRGWGHRWHANFGWRHYTLRGLRPCLCSPLRPHAPAVRLRWQLPTPANKAWRGAIPGALRHLGWMTTLIALQVAVALPALLLSHAALPTLLAMVVCLYLTIAAALLWTVRHRQSLRLAAQDCAALCAELLLCPPYAANLVRRLSLRLSPDGDLVATARSLMSADEQRAVAAHCAAMLAEELEATDSDAPHAATLAQARRHFEHAIESGQL